jgi:hypothetical protein
MEDVPSFLKRAAEQCGFTRDYYIDNNIPTNSKDIVVVHIFGDWRNEFVLSSLLLKRFRDELRGSKYMILCTWKGRKGLFPYADEHWSPSDKSSYELLRHGALGLENSSEVYVQQRKSLNYFFHHIITPEEVVKFYDNGITGHFREKLGTIKRFLPMVPSASFLGSYINQELINRLGVKVCLMPTRQGRGFVNGKLRIMRSSREFWKCLLNRLVKSGYCPVVIQNHATYDLSGEFHDKAIFCQEEDVSKVLGLMRATGCVIDVFNGTSRLAIAARTPFVAVDDRGRFAEEREFEIDDLCAFDLSKQYIFSFPTILENGDVVSWNSSLFDLIIARLNRFTDNLDRDALPSTSESVVEVPFSAIREQRAKRLGTQFIKIPRD